MVVMFLAFDLGVVVAIGEDRVDIAGDTFLQKLVGKPIKSSLFFSC